MAERAWTVPYYRDAFVRAGLGPEDLRSMDALQQLPFLTKSILQQEFRNQGSQRGKGGFEVVTSGSTGEPHRVFRTDREQAEISATWDRLFTAFGRRRWDRQVNIGSGRPVAKQGPVARLRDLGFLPRLHQLSSFDSLQQQIQVLQRVRPHMISSYAVALESLAEAVLDVGIRQIRPRIVYSSAMSLTDRCRTLCRDAFGVTPLDVYATVEIGPVAWECPSNPGALHLNDDVLVVEVVDSNGRPVPDGQSGELVITQLTGFAQPLIRYRIGDLGYRTSGTCPCGRGLGLMGPVAGRTRHTVKTADGRVLNSAVVGSAISSFGEVRRWQARQLTPHLLRVLLVPSPAWNDRSMERIRASLEAKLAGSLQLDLVTVPEIPVAPNGKVQTIVPLDDPAPISRGPLSDQRFASEVADYA